MTTANDTTKNKRQVGYKVFVESFKLAYNDLNEAKLTSHIQSLTFIEKGEIKHYTEASIKSQIAAIKNILIDGEEWTVLKEASQSNRVAVNTRNQAKTILKHYNR